MPIAAPGFRLPDETRLGKVALQIADLDRSLEYYLTILGFRLLDRAGSTARLGAADGDQVLLELHEHPGARSVPRRGLLGLYHFAVLLPSRPDLGRFLKHVESRGIRPGASEHLVSEALYLVDPDGITIEVYRDRPRAEWPIREGQMIAAVDPLDREGVLGAAGAEPWTGMPAGTTIGHVHFFVDDIAAAEAFYHAALGFDKTIWNLPGLLFVAAGGYHHHVGLNTWAAGAPAAGAEDAKLLFWELVLPDAVISRAVESLGRTGHPVVAADGVRAASDPWGITVHLVSRAGR
ncbi:MAG TPA: VOC family protein [Gemmatimonadales bacterium]|nr:VOC family protein [Gemmatimonadales bacterium]